MNGTVGCRWVLRKRGAEPGGDSWMLVDVGRPAAPPPHRRCFETEGAFQNSFETPSPSINFQQLRNR